MATASTHQVTELLLAWREGEEHALDQLVPLVHQELRRLAHRHMRGERHRVTLQTTALVNEAYVRLVDSRNVKWQNRAHFLAISSQLMRRILVDMARSRRSQKRGGEAEQISLDEGMVVSTEPGKDLIALDEALKALTEMDERKGKVVEMRFFGGLSAKETAEVLGVSEDTVLRDWRLSKAWLLRELSGEEAE